MDSPINLNFWRSNSLVKYINLPRGFTYHSKSLGRTSHTFSIENSALINYRFS